MNEQCAQKRTQVQKCNRTVSFSKITPWIGCVPRSSIIYRFLNKSRGNVFTGSASRSSPDQISLFIARIADSLFHKNDLRPRRRTIVSPMRQPRSGERNHPRKNVPNRASSFSHVTTFALPYVSRPRDLFSASSIHPANYQREYFLIGGR